MKRQPKVAIQGGKTSFHELASQRYFKDQDVALIECRTFKELALQLVDRHVTHALMAIENTIVGSILPNYTLLQTHPLQIVDEVYLHIQHNLMALPGQQLSDIKAVKSHPIALQQCSDFLESHPFLRSIETYDTADSAKEIREHEERNVAAIAARETAKFYDLEIIAQSIENIKSNYTRFLVLMRENDIPANSGSNNKASLSFHVMHKVGALAQVLDVLRTHGLNLSLIQSTPILGKPDEYAFHIDVEWLEQLDYADAIAELRTITRELKILGEYQAGQKPYAHTDSR